MRSSPSPVSFRIITHNIRYAASNRAEGEDAWAVRRSHLCNELRFNTLYCPESFICLQEVLHNQLIDIYDDLNANEPQWTYIGVGRDDGKEAGEYSSIFYRPTVWELLDHQNVWLSETPERPSRGWDAASTRILTIGKFRHVESREIIVAMNTHLDDQGAKSRKKAAEIILRQIDSCCRDEEEPSALLPVFVSGDFNSPPGDGAYQTMTASESPMTDLRTLVPEEERYGHEHTFSGFDDWNKPMTRLDFVFLNSKMELPLSRWVVKSYAVLENRFEDRVYSSDHRAVVGDVILL